MTMTGSDLRKIRELAGFTQEQLADAIGMTRTWLGITERKADRVERRTEYAVRYLAERRKSHSSYLRQVAATTKWISDDDAISGASGEFQMILRREPQARWSITVSHPRSGFVYNPPRWEQSLDDAKASAILHAQLARLDLSEYQAQLIS